MYADSDIFNSAINKGLKIVGEKIGVSDLEFYAARHTFATIARIAALHKITYNPFAT